MKFSSVVDTFLHSTTLYSYVYFKQMHLLELIVCSPQLLFFFTIETLMYKLLT